MNKELAKIYYTMADTHKQAKMYYTKAHMHKLQGDTVKAIESYRQAIELFINKDDKARAYYGLGDVNLKSGDIVKAIECYTQATDLFTACKDKTKSYNSLGISYYEKSNFEQSLDCHKKALLFAESRVERNKTQELINKAEAELASSLNFYAADQLRNGKYTEAIELWDRAISLYKKDSDKTMARKNKVQAHIKLAEQHEANNEYIKATEQYNKAILNFHTSK